MFSINASPVKCFDNATFAPRSPKKVPSVITKEGRPVQTTSTPFHSPSARHTNNESSAANHRFIPHSVAMMPISAPAVPTITPVDKSNSPLIISRPTATAMIPYGQAVSSTRATVEISNIAPELAMLKKMNSNAAATKEPSSGRKTAVRTQER